MKLYWTFPPTGGGVSQGFHDSGQAIFGADAWDKTVREIIQNSLDAVRDSDKPVTVRISRMQVPSSEIGATDLTRHIESALKRTRRDGYERGVKFFQRALKILKKRQIPTLAIVDSNTSGLVGQKWDALVHEEGTSSKGTMKAAGGSFGIGKNAPYLISGVKTICYSTRYLAKGRQEWFIARCKISAHQDPRQPARELQHIGFGTKSKVAKGARAPPTRGKEIYRGFRLAEPGTGIFIIGSDIPESWISKSEQSLARNFFAAIHEKKLEIVIDQRRLDYETLDSVFESDKKHRTYHYYRLMRGSSKPACVDGEFGKFEVYLSTDEEDAPNRMAYVNRRGMMITDVRQFGKNPFHTSVGSGWAQYAVVVRAADDKTDERVRAMEPPSHDSIEYERTNDRDHDRVRLQLKEIQKKIEQLTLDALNQSGKSGETVLSEIEALGAEGPDGSGHGKGEQNLTTRRIRTKPKKTMDKPDGPGPEIAIGGKTERDNADDDSSRQKPPPGTGPKGVSSLDRQRVMRHRNKIRVAFTPRAASVHFSLKPAGEEPKRQHSISIRQARIVSPDNIRADVQDDVVSIRAGDCARIIVDLEVDGDAAYTGYELLEYVVPGGAR